MNFGRYPDKLEKRGGNGVTLNVTIIATVIQPEEIYTLPFGWLYLPNSQTTRNTGNVCGLYIRLKKMNLQISTQKTPLVQES